MAALLSISTDRLRLTLTGPPAPPDPTAGEGVLSVRPLRSAAEPVVEVGGERVAWKSSLRLAEQTAYRLFVASRAGAAVTVEHRDPALTRDLASGDGGRVVAGTINFGGQVGRSVFVLRVDDEPEVEIGVDVFPTKVSAADVEAMRATIDDTLAGLAFAYLRATTAGFESSESPPARATWLSGLRRALADLDSALDRIAAHPYRDLVREVEVTRAERIRRPDATLRAAVRRGDGAGTSVRLREGMVVRARLPERRARPTLDTPEHRWLRARLDAARRTVSNVRAEERLLSPTPRRRRMLAEMEQAERRLVRLLRMPPMAAATPGPPPAPSARLLTAPGYAEAYRACRMLDAALSAVAGPSPHATKDLWMLYELWGYLTLCRTVAQHLGVPFDPRAFFRGEHRGLRLRLRRGRRHAVRLVRGDVRVTLAYNPQFSSRLGLLTQRPDILMTVRREQTQRRFVLDAKYRRDDGERTVRRYGVPAPPETALGDLHRYRDAIVGADGARTVEQAIALYPYRADERFDDSPLWTAIEHIGVGAIPLVPGATGRLERWVARVLQD